LKRLKTVLLTCVLFLSNSSPSLATSIFAVRTPTAIVIGADSKAGTFDVPGSMSERCKIGEANNVVWAVAGSIENTHIQLKFSAHTEAKINMSQPGGFFDRLRNFRQSLGQKLGHLFGTLAKYERDVFLKTMSGRRITEIIVAAADRGEMRMAVLKYYSRRENETQIFSDQQIYPASGTRREETNWVEIGTTDIHQPSVADDPELLNRGEEAAIRRLLEIAIEKHPKIVGPPISLVRIEKDKINWIERGMCQE
jgi:hypothetical protein